MNFLMLTSFKEVTGYIGYILLAILILLIMITAHEAGHYFAGKLFGFGIEEFAIGFGPKLFSRKKKDGEVFSVRLFPFGGFCSFRGEDGDLLDKTAFNSFSPWKRIIVLFAGAFTNFILSLLIITVMFCAYGQTAFTVGKVQVNSNYAVEKSLQDGDIILSANGKTVFLSTDLMNALKDKKQGDGVEFTVKRQGKTEKITVILRADTTFESVEDMASVYRALGVEHSVKDGKVASAEFYTTTVKLSFFEILYKSPQFALKLAGSIFTVLGQLLTGKIGISSMGGTVTTIAMTADVIKVGGFKYFLYMTAFIGVNLAVFNLLPFPALDGARIVFCLIEWVRKKPVSRRVEGIIHTVGFVLLILFAVFVDLRRCF